MNNKKVNEITKLIPDETFDMDSNDLREYSKQCNSLLVSYLEDIRSDIILPDISMDQMKKKIWEPLPQSEMDLSDVLIECQEKIISNAVRFGHPRFLGWVLSSGTFSGALADGIASTINQNVAVSGARMATVVELLVLDWIKQIIGYDRNAAGILVSGGSQANLIGLVVARNVSSDFDIGAQGLFAQGKMLVYASEEVHFCIPKAINILGIGTDNIRWVKVDQDFCMDVKDLEKQIVEDRGRGYHPFCVVATAGTVNTGAIDPLDSIAGICERYNLWFHVDAAYGGFASISSNLKPLMKALDRADSLVLDPHKWLFIPYEAGCILVKNPEHMRKTFSMEASYLHLNDDGSTSKKDVDFSDYGIQLSRQFRALKIWMSLKQYGMKKYGRLIDQNVQLTRYLEALVDESSDFEILTPTSLSVCCFRYYPRDLREKNNGGDTMENDKITVYLNDLNLSIAKAMRLDQRVVLSSTMLKDKFALRACIINFRTMKKDIRDIVEIIRELGVKEDTKLRKTKW